MSEMEYLEDFEEQQRRDESSDEDFGKATASPASEDDDEPEIHIPAADIRMILHYYQKKEEMRLMREHQEASKYQERDADRDGDVMREMTTDVDHQEMDEHFEDAKVEKEAAQEPDIDQERDGDVMREMTTDVDHQEMDKHFKDAKVEKEAAQEPDIEMTIEEQGSPVMIPPTPPRMFMATPLLTSKPYGFRKELSVSSGSIYPPSEGETDDEEEGDGEKNVEVVEEETENLSKRKRRPTARRRKSIKQLKRRQRQCEMPGCTSRVINMTRHYQQLHPGTPAPKTVERTYAGSFACPNCNVCAVRLDLHLLRIHELEKGSVEYIESMAAARQVTPVVRKKQADDLDRALVEYRAQLQDRAVGDRRTEATARSHVAAVKKLLPSLTKEEIERLQDIGKKDGLVDSLLEKGTLSAASLRTYLHSLVRFLQFLSASTQWMRHLGMMSSVVQSVKAKLQMISNSLKQDVARQAVEAAAQCPAGQLNLKPWMVGAYLASNDRPPAEHAGVLPCQKLPGGTTSAGQCQAGRRHQPPGQAGHPAGHAVDG